MSYSLQQAADAAGVNKSTILRAIQTGKVSASRDEHKQWVIEPAELHRVYPPAAAGNGKVKDASRDTNLAEANQRAALAERDAALAEREAALLRATIEDLRYDRDAWREQAQRLALPAPDSAARRRRWWSRLRPNVEHNLVPA